jgi:hypothetical protein
MAVTGSFEIEARDRVHGWIFTFARDGVSGAAVAMASDRASVCQYCERTEGAPVQWPHGKGLCAQHRQPAAELPLSRQHQRGDSKPCNAR